MTSSVLRVLFVVTDSGTGGSEKVLTTLLERMDPKVVQPVGVIVLKKIREVAEQWREKGIPVWALGMRQVPTPAILRALTRQIQQTSPHIVHSFLFHSAQACRLIRYRIPQVKLITSPRVNYRIIPWWARKLDQFLANNDDCVIAESQATKNFLIDSQKYPQQKVSLVRNGVDTDVYVRDEGKRHFWRKQWGFSDNDLVVGSVGRLHSQKGFDVLLEALKQLKSRYPQLKFVVVGEGPEQKSLLQFSAQHNLPVQFVGRIPSPAGFYSAFDGYVQSSRYEGLSNSLLEAMSVGLPIVATAVDGTLDIGRDHENMLLVPPQDAVQLASAMEALIVDSSLAEQLAHAARKSALNLTLQKMVKDTENIYRTLVPL